MKKELAIGFIGKLPLCGAQLEVPPLVTLDNVSKNKKRTRPRQKKQKKPRKNLEQRFNEMSSSLSPASQLGTISKDEKQSSIPQPIPHEQEEDDEEEEEENQSSDEEDEETEDSEDSTEILFLNSEVKSSNIDSSTSKHEEEEEEEDDDDEDDEEEDEEDDEELFIAQPRGIINLPESVHQQQQQQQQQKQRRENSTFQPRQKCLVVLDAPNIARKHGKKSFSSKGLLICVDYWRNKGHKVVAFLPEHYVSRKPNPGATMTVSEYLEPKLIVDDKSILDKLERQEVLFYTPPQDYDDSYCIQYARQNNGVIVTNDLYRDHIEKTNDKDKGRVRRWIRQHCISFLFVGDQFVPNPDFEFPTHCAS